MNQIQLRIGLIVFAMLTSLFCKAQTPIADAGPDINLDCTTTSGLIGTAAVMGNTYSWSPATGLDNASSAQPLASPTVTTTYTLTVTDGFSNTATDEVIVNVDQTAPVANAGSDIYLGCTTSGQIGVASLIGYTYSWSPTSDLSSSTVSQPTASPTTTTTYTVTVTGSNGCTASDNVVVNYSTTPPTANAGSDLNLDCTTTSGAIGSSSVSGNTYSWSPSSHLSSSTVSQPTANPSTTTTSTVTVTVANGCTATDEVIVNVDQTAPVANAGSDIYLGCTTSGQIGVASVIGYTYSWSPTSDLSSSTVSQPTASPTTTTTNTVTVTGSNGCTASDNVVVNYSTTPPTANAGSDINLDCTTTSGAIVSLKSEKESECEEKNQSEN